jgi:hypothetical protein
MPDFVAAVAGLRHLAAKSKQRTKDTQHKVTSDVHRIVADAVSVQSFDPSK